MVQSVGKQPRTREWWRWFGLVKGIRENEGRPLTDLTDWIPDWVGPFTVIGQNSQFRF
jgi:hypothetical protein